MLWVILEVSDICVHHLICLMWQIRIIFKIPLLEAEDSQQMLSIPPYAFVFSLLRCHIFFASNSLETVYCCTIPVISFELSGFLLLCSYTTSYSTTSYTWIRIILYSTGSYKLNHNTNLYVRISTTTNTTKSYMNSYKFPTTYNWVIFNWYSTMNYKSISNEICHLVEQMNKWSSTITIHQGDDYLDISSAAMGK